MPMEFPVKVGIGPIELPGKLWAVSLSFANPPYNMYQVNLPLAMVTEKFCADLSSGLWDTAEKCRRRTSGLILPNG